MSENKIGLTICLVGLALVLSTGLGAFAIYYSSQEVLAELREMNAGERELAEEEEQNAELRDRVAVLEEQLAGMQTTEKGAEELLPPPTPTGHKYFSVTVPANSGCRYADYYTPATADWFLWSDQVVQIQYQFAESEVAGRLAVDPFSNGNEEPQWRYVPLSPNTNFCIDNPEEEPLMVFLSVGPTQMG